jgi:transglutaminase-like putative cysteine protease
MPLDYSVAVASFLGTTERLTIASEVTIEHYEEAPLDFLVADYAVNYPFVYNADERFDLSPFQSPVYAKDRTALQAWFDRLGIGHGTMQTYVLLDRMNKAIARELKYVIREEPGVQSPAQTLASGNASCRDYATLFMEACRFLGLASRFVSGYVHAPETEEGNANTHAWAEVYLPGPGWKGFDPSTGEVTGARHIPVAVARHPETVSPVAGSFIGLNGPSPSLLVDVRVESLQ